MRGFAALQGTSRLRYNLQKVGVFQTAHSDKIFKPRLVDTLYHRIVNISIRISRVHTMRLKKDEIYDIINADGLANASLGLRPLRTLCACVIDGFAKMSLQANIFASWYNKVSKFRR